MINNVFAYYESCSDLACAAQLYGISAERRVQYRLVRESALILLAFLPFLMAKRPCDYLSDIVIAKRRKVAPRPLSASASPSVTDR